jgi:hypothetical protein
VHLPEVGAVEDASISPQSREVSISPFDTCFSMSLALDRKRAQIEGHTRWGRGRYG